jgi:hypothetical protein
MGTRIPETPDEEVEVGDGPHFANLFLEEYVSPPTFDPSSFSTKEGSGQFDVLLRQFNSAKESKLIVDKFLGYFKVLEKAYAHGRGGNLFAVLRQSDNLFSVVREVICSPSSENDPMSHQEFQTFIKDLIRIRDNCAHLREKTGYSPNDPRIQTEVAPLVDVLGIIAQKVVERHL